MHDEPLDATFDLRPYLRAAAPTCLAMTVAKLTAAIVGAAAIGVDHHWVRRLVVFPLVVFETDRAGLARITAASTLVATGVALALLLLHGLRAHSHARFLGGALGVLAAAEMVVVDSLTNWGGAAPDVVVCQALSAALVVAGVLLVAARLLRGGRSSRLVPTFG